MSKAKEGLELKKPCQYPKSLTKAIPCNKIRQRENPCFCEFFFSLYFWMKEKLECGSLQALGREETSKQKSEKEATLGFGKGEEDSPFFGFEFEKQNSRFQW